MPRDPQVAACVVSFREKHPLKWSRRVARSIAILAFALLGPAPAARGMTLAVAPAVHTATADGHLRVRHHHRAHRRHLHAQFSRARVSPFAPGQRRPAPHRAERRAAVPQALRRDRQGHGARDGQAAAASATADGFTAASRRLDGTRLESVPGGEGRVISGRGPPRARAVESHIPALFGGPSGHLRSAARVGSAPAASRVLPAFRVSPRPATSRPPFLVSVPPEPLPVRSRVRRPEGTAARLPAPSHGESP